MVLAAVFRTAMNLLLKLVTAPTIARKISEMIRPYSIAVAPD